MPAASPSAPVARTRTASANRVTLLRAQRIAERNMRRHASWSAIATGTPDTGAREDRS